VFLTLLQLSFGTALAVTIYILAVNTLIGNIIETCGSIKKKANKNGNDSGLSLMTVVKRTRGVN
jgi:hypothetical protein